ncbi:S1/P1 nuclease [Novosphingobium sp.]|uniref:S1/P1 nuclease n=1 Tax=Novosphingobium sp. TaxID=1874826 RepID=UPI0025E73427|nr:S1/P1 nuclease [Novosphingobium sp.]MCC6925213.1 S1/P1 nuclease [Novosphingobium sp.]
MRRLRRALASAAALGLALVAGSGPALGWSQPTHQVTGAIAWQDLRQNHPAELAELLSLIRQHQDYPRFERHFAALAPEAQQRALFEVLGRWPDDIRGGPEDHPDWHYQLRVVSGRTWLWRFENGNAAFGFGHNYTKLANPCASAAERAKAIGWLIHIIGDVQQPLHAGHQMTSVYSATDRSGQLAFVKRPNGKVTDLHQFWDGTLEDSGVTLPTGETNWADALTKAWPRTRLPHELTRRGETRMQFYSFLDESAILARLVAYQGTYLQGSPDPARAPMVSQAEQDRAITIAQRRIATGGYRIADLLAQAIKDAKAVTWTCPA